MATSALDRGGSGVAGSLSRRRISGGIVAVVAIAAALLPLWASSYHLFQVTFVVVNAIALLGLNLLTGYGGQISLGHGAFYGIGAYTTAVLAHHFGFPLWATIPCAGALCMVIGYIFGLPAVRLDGLHLALATLALGAALPQMLKYKGIENLTGGVQGISIDKAEAPFGLPLSPDQWLYLLALAIAIVLFVAAHNLVSGHTGRAIIAIRDQPVAAVSAGVDSARYKAITFGISALYTGVAGALSAMVVQFVSPDSFSFILSIGLLVGIVVGGLASIQGAIYGAVFIQFIPDLADAVSKAAPSAVYGIVLILTVYLMPRGVTGLLEKGLGRLRARRLRLRADARQHSVSPTKESP